MLSSMKILPRSPWGWDSTTLGPGLLLSLRPLSSPLLYGFVWPHKSSLPAQLPRSLLCQASDLLPSSPHSHPTKSHGANPIHWGFSLRSHLGHSFMKSLVGKEYMEKDERILIGLFDSLTFWFPCSTGSLWLLRLTARGTATGRKSLRWSAKKKEIAMCNE